MVARRQIVLALVSALEPIVGRISELTIEIRHALEAHPDGRTFRSLFIAPDSWLCAATMLAEIGDCRERYPTYRTLAADAGQAPVAVESASPSTPSSDGRATTDSATRSLHRPRSLSTGSLPGIARPRVKPGRAVGQGRGLGRTRRRGRRTPVGGGGGDHETRPRALSISQAAVISPTWLNAWGKLPSSSPFAVSISSASSPRSLA